LAKKSDTKSGNLFIAESGQLRLADKSIEQQRMESGKIECLGMTFASNEERRHYFLEKLKENLTDPEFRKLPGFPKGSDEDILRLSDPPYHTACPNPFLSAFVAHASTRNQSLEEYRRSPYALDLSGAKNDEVYNAHGYHTKVPPEAIEQLLCHYTQEGDIVLDPFAGSGMTGVAAARTGRVAILADLSPAATAIADGYVHNAGDLREDHRCREILESVSNEWGWLYETDHTGWDASIREPSKRTTQNTVTPDHRGEVQFLVWSDVFVCPECGTDLVYWEVAVDFEKKAARQDFSCPSCAASVGKRDLERRWETVYDPSLRIPRQKAVRRPVLVNYIFRGRRYEKTPDERDLAVLGKVRELRQGPYEPIPMLFKQGKWGDQWRDGYHSDISHAHDFLFERSAIVLSAIWERVRDDRDLRFWFTSTLPWCTRENRLHLGNYFGKKGGVITSLRGTLYFASLMVETNPLARFRLRVSSASISRPTGGHRVAITTQSASSLKQLAPCSIDYCFVDPPFGDNLMYSELNFQWESWLRVFTNQREEAVVSKTQGKGISEYSTLMKEAFAEIYRVLKPARWMTVEFHNSRNGVWMAIQEALQLAGFVVADVRVLDKGKGSFNAVMAAGAVNKDLIISTYKPTSAFEERFRLEAGTEEGVWHFLRNHLTQLPIFVSKAGCGQIIAERQSHLLYDRMVAFHVQRCVTIPLSASTFYSGLAQRYSERDGMYFLPEQVAEYDKKRTGVAELQQLSLFVVDEATAIQWVRQQLSSKPLEFQELQPAFMQELQGWAKHETTVELREILEQNFLRYDGRGPVPSQIHAYLSSNFKDLRNLPKDAPSLVEKARDRWYVPDTSKQVDLEKLRERSLLRDFSEYVESKQRKLKQFRTEAVRTGFKRAYEDQDYKKIIAVAAKLPEVVLQEDDKLLMYYDVARMRLGED